MLKALEILRDQYHVELERAELELNLLLTQAGVIPDHTCYMDSVDKLVGHVEAAQSKLQVLDGLLAEKQKGNGDDPDPE